MPDNTDPALSLTTTFESVRDAVRSAAWHTIIDGAAHEVFVDDLSVSDFRDAIETLRANGFATERVERASAADPDGSPEGAAFFVGDGAAEVVVDITDEMVRVNGERGDFFGDALPGVDGFTIERVPSGLPDWVVVFVDADAIARVPTNAGSVGRNDTFAVSSPVVVTEPDGIAVIDVAENTN
jgi:hypothetical protein